LIVRKPGAAPKSSPMRLRNFWENLQEKALRKRKTRLKTTFQSDHFFLLSFLFYFCFSIFYFFCLSVSSSSIVIVFLFVLIIPLKV